MNNKKIPLLEAKQYKIETLGFGHFNTIHPGHIRYLKYARKLGSPFCIALIGDGENKQNPRFQFTQDERAEALLQLSIVDFIILLKDNEIDEAISLLEPKELILGKEFEFSNQYNIKHAIQIQNNAERKVKYYAGDINYASTDLLKSSQRELLNRKKIEFRSACLRCGLTKTKLLNSIESWKDTSLIVIGDTILDQYSACEALGISAEAPVVVVKELQTKNFIGGAAIVASHIQSLGANCEFISVVGNDEIAKNVEKKLSEQNIKNHLITDSSRPTTLKKRYIVENQKLFRVSRLEDHFLDKKIESKVIQKIETLAPKVKGIVISDFIYGVITKNILSAIVNLADKYNLLLFGDLQCSSQIGSILKFKNFTLLCPNEKEARLALQDKESGLELLSQNLIEKTNSQKLIMKLGPNGLIAYDKVKSDKLVSQPFPALSANPVDLAGAGDSLLAAMANGLTSKKNIMETAAIGCCVAALAVESMGNTPITSHQLKNYISEIL